MKSVVLHSIHLFIVSLFILVFSGPVLAQVIYGLEKTQYFNTRQQGPFIIQAGSFQSAKNAQRLKAQLADRLDYPVQIKSSQQHYTVVIGPLSTPEEVRSVGRTVITPLQKHPKKIRVRPLNPSLSYQPQPEPIQVSTPAPLPAKGHWFVGTELDLLWPNVNDRMTVPNGSNFPPPENLDNYSISKPSNQPMLALSAGYRWQRNQALIPAYALALRYQHLFSQNLQGEIQQYSLNEFNNYTYTWDMNLDVLSLNSKINLFKYQRIMPYIDAGIGASFNQSETYREQALPGITARDSPSFASHTQTEFAYNAGAGIDLIVTNQLLLSLGYDYQSFGHLRSGSGQSTWTGTSLKLGNFTTNTILLGLTYQIDDASDHA